jgi:hypothetical protein
LLCASKVYSGLGADIVMESFHSLILKKAKEKRTLVIRPDFNTYGRWEVSTANRQV